MSKSDDLDLVDRAEAIFWGGVFVGVLGTMFLIALLGEVL